MALHRSVRNAQDAIAKLADKFTCLCECGDADTCVECGLANWLDQSPPLLSRFRAMMDANWEREEAKFDDRYGHT